jgi:hypothetical protein
VQATLPQLHDLSAMSVCSCVESFFILHDANQYNSGTSSVGILTLHLVFSASNFIFEGMKSLCMIWKSYWVLCKLYWGKLFAYLKDLQLSFKCGSCHSYLQMNVEAKLVWLG